MSEYLKFTEHNEWEGETWRFYLKIKGNEEEIGKLKLLLKQEPDNRFYDLSEEIIIEKEVDVLVENGREGYMYSDNKLDKWKCPDKIGDLYKGGLIIQERSNGKE